MRLSILITPHAVLSILFFQTKQTARPNRRPQVAWNLLTSWALQLLLLPIWEHPCKTELLCLAAGPPLPLPMPMEQIFEKI